MKNRVIYADVLRLLAIFLVVTIHVIAGFRDSYVATNHLYYFILTTIDSLTRIAVPIFFMLTGAFMLSSKGDLKYSEFLKKRLPKLVIPFIIFSLFYYFFLLYINNGTFSLKTLISQLTSSGGTCYHMWFMSAIIMLYLLIPFFNTLIKNIKQKDLLILIVLIFIFGNVFTTINAFTTKYGFDLLTGFTLPKLIIYANYLFLGYYLYKYDIKKKKLLYVLGIISILLIPIADYLYIDNARNDIMLTVAVAFPFLPAAALFTFFKNNYTKLRIPNIIENLAIKSNKLVYYIYLVHVFVLIELNRQIAKYYIPTRFIENICFLFIKIILVFIISYFLAILCEKIYSLFERLTNKNKCV